MTAATTKFTTSNDVLAALVAACTAVQWNGAPAFGLCRSYDQQDLVTAFQELLISKQRVCLIIPSGESWEPAAQSTGTLRVHRTLEYLILISDRVEGQRQKATFGEGAAHVGAHGLKDLVLPAVTGQIVDNPVGCLAWPTDVSEITVNTEGNSLPGRAAVGITLTVRGGHMVAALNAGPVR